MDTGRKMVHSPGVAKLDRKKSGSLGATFSPYGERWTVECAGGEGPFLHSVAMRKEFPPNILLVFLYP